MSVIRGNAAAIVSVLVLVVGAWMWADKIDIGLILDKLANIDPFLAVLAFLAWLSFSPLNAYRLKCMVGWVAGSHVPYFLLLRLTCIGYFVAATGPLGLLGDVAKVTLLRPVSSLSWRESIHCVLCDRASGAIFVAFLGICFLPARLFLRSSNTSLFMEFWIFLAVVGCAMLAMSLHRLLMRADRRSWHEVGSVLSAVAQLFRGKARVGAQIIFALLNVALTLCAFFFLARGMAIPIDPWRLAQYMPIIMLVVSLPVLYLGWGGRELVVVATIGSLGGVSENLALSLSIALGFLAMLAAIPNGLFLLTTWRRR
jgi:hypothetical protein